MIRIVVPTFNEAANIRVLIPKIHQVMKGHDYKVIIVDDNSPDGTARVAEELSKEYPVDVFVQPVKRGLGAAYGAGFKRALQQGAKYVVSMDGDLSHDPALLPSFIEAAQKYDVVVGSRYIPGGGIPDWAWHRRLVSWGGNMVARAILGLRPHDVTSSYRCYRAGVLSAIDLPSIVSNGYAFPEEVLFRCSKLGCAISEVPIVFRERRQGVSKLGPSEIPTFIITMLRLRFSRRRR